MMIKVYGRFTHESSDDNDAGIFAFPEDAISYIKYYQKGKYPKDEVAKKPIQAIIIFHHSEDLDNFNVMEFKD